jgi:plasmid stabilization system protein ParE
MAARVVIAPAAANDVAEAYAWYESRRAGLGEDFLSAVDACIQAICRAPEAHAQAHENYRRSLVRRFPYAVFYEDAAGDVTVYGVFHTSRDPQKWRQRLSSPHDAGGRQPPPRG